MEVGGGIGAYATGIVEHREVETYVGEIVGRVVEIGYGKGIGEGVKEIE